ncbi:MAG: hypothetical protein ACK2U3_02905 [Anaerolineales bacterium]
MTSRLPEGYWINPYKTTFDKLSEVCGFDTRKALVEFGAKKIRNQTKHITRIWNKRKKDLCVVFEEGNLWLPVFAFAISRIIPLYNG